MRSRSWLFILVIGIAGMAMMGFLTKFALESNPGLLRIVKLKEAIAEEMGPRGVEEISVRALPENRGLEIRLDIARARLPDPSAFARSVAELFLRKYGGTVPAFLKLSLIEEVGWGCGGPVTYFQDEYRLLELTAEMALRDALGRLKTAVEARKGFTILSAEPTSPLRVVACVPPPADDAELERSMEFLRMKAREHVAAGSGRIVVLEARSEAAAGAGPAGGKVLREERIERRGVTRLQPRPEPSPGAGR